MADSLSNFFDKANSKVQGAFNKLLGMEASPMMPPGHSGVFFGPMNASGVPRTRLISYETNPNPDRGQLSPAISVGSEGYPAGFTPISYYSRDYDTFSGKLTAFFIGNNDNSAVASGKSLDVSTKQLMDTETKLKNNKEYLNKFNDDNLKITNRKVGENDAQTDFKFSLQDDKYLKNFPGEFNPGIPKILVGNDPRNSFTGTNEPKSWVTSKFHSGGKGTPFENEDPVYFGFELIINTQNSPIFNGVAAEFIQQLGFNVAGEHLEIKSRKEILESFNFEIQKFFKFNDLVDTNGVITGGPYVNRRPDQSPDKDQPANYKNLYNSNIKKRHYIKKIEGLDKLIEANTSAASAAFVKWKTDLIKLTFYEDVNLSTGTLLNLYKLLYWSRKRGKGVLPENILRFDCEIIVSEIRNIARVRQIINDPPSVDDKFKPGDNPTTNVPEETPIGPLQEDGTFVADGTQGDAATLGAASTQGAAGTQETASTQGAAGTQDAGGAAAINNSAGLGAGVGSGGAPAQVGSTLTLNNVVFETASSTLSGASTSELDKAVDFLTKNPNMKIEIGGHTDNAGSESSNLTLSEQRAQSVSGYLTSKGIDGSRITSKGYGESNPVADNATSAGRSQNRRTTLKILSNDPSSTSQSAAPLPSASPLLVPPEADAVSTLSPFVGSLSSLESGTPNFDLFAPSSQGTPTNAAPLVPNSPFLVPPVAAGNGLGFGSAGYTPPTTGPADKDVAKSVDPQYESKVLEIIKENVSRYRYSLYECQFHVSAMPHPGTIDQTIPLTPYDSHTVDISFKHSDMSFERFDYRTLATNKGQYITLNNGLLDPQAVSSIDTQRFALLAADGDVKTIKPLANQVDFVRLDVITDNNPDSQSSASDILLGLVNSDDILGDIKEIDKKDKFKGALKNAGKNLLKATKTAVTNEAQRQLNDRFRLLNNTLEKVKQAYGLGQISAPTNVYDIKPGSQPFFDVMNALRNFTGDVLGSALGG